MQPSMFTFTGSFQSPVKRAPQQQANQKPVPTVEVPQDKLFAIDSVFETYTLFGDKFSESAMDSMTANEWNDTLSWILLGKPGHKLNAGTSNNRKNLKQSFKRAEQELTEDQPIIKPREVLNNDILHAFVEGTSNLLVCFEHPTEPTLLQAPIKPDTIVPNFCYSLSDQESNIYLIGGVTQDKEESNLIWQWKKGKLKLFTKLKQPRKSMSCCLIGKMIYVIGGKSGNVFLHEGEKVLLDGTAEDRVSKLGIMRIAAQYPCISPVGSSHIFKLGGTEVDLIESRYLIPPCVSMMEIYSIEDNTWTFVRLRGNKQPHHRFTHSLMVPVESSDYELLIFGGKYFPTLQLRLILNKALDQACIMEDSTYVGYHQYGQFMPTRPIVRGTSAFALTRTQQLIQVSLQ